MKDIVIRSDDESMAEDFSMGNNDELAGKSIDIIDDDESLTKHVAVGNDDESLANVNKSGKTKKS